MIFSNFKFPIAINWIEKDSHFICKILNMYLWRIISQEEKWKQLLIFPVAFYS